MGPYPGYNESHRSWVSRWRSWEHNRDRNRKEEERRDNNYGGYNYRCVETDTYYDTPDGRRLYVAKVGYGPRNARAVERYAQKHGLCFEFCYWPGNIYTGRTDGIAYGYAWQPNVCSAAPYLAAGWTRDYFARIWGAGNDEEYAAALENGNRRFGTNFGKCNHS